MITHGWLTCPHCNHEGRVIGIVTKTPVECAVCRRPFMAVPGKEEGPQETSPEGAFLPLSPVRVLRGTR